MPPSLICNGEYWCDNRVMGDEKDCYELGRTDSSCRHIATGERVPVPSYVKCMPITRSSYSDSDYQFSPETYCILEDVASYQTNCSDPAKVALSCDIKGYESTVSKYMICFDDEIKVCDDGIESKCYRTSSCKVHKHRMCDKKSDCDDNTDETHFTCQSTTLKTCERRVGKEGALPIPISWLHDGVRDCMDGADEITEWQKCGEGKTLRYKSSLENNCENVFVCRTGDPGYELLGNLCDGLENCGNENKICSVSTRSYDITSTVSTTNRGLTKTLSFCFKGLESLQFHVSACVNEKFIYPNEDIFGVSETLVIRPNNTQSCENMYGEQYLYTSCTGRCKEASCPLRNIPRYEVCPGQVPDRIGTIVSNEYLIFVTKSYGTVYTNRYFVCDNKITCIDFSKVCDLVKDCEDGSDEEQCSNHFKCNSSGKLLPKTKKCDKHIDCADLSDECNDQCFKTILEGVFLKGLSWSIGFLAIVANKIIIVKSLRSLRRCRTTAALINKLLIILIALGDLLIGCYLFIIAAYDTMIFKNSYCKKQIAWITSFECSAIGVFSTIGSQISLFAMTGLSLVRMHGIWNSMRIPGEVTLIKVSKISAAIFSLIILSTTIAVVPILKKLEDFFVNGVKFADEMKIFIGTPIKETLLDVIQAYYGRATARTSTWKTLTKMVKDMFSHESGYEDYTVDVDKVDFYGNDGVCLFKYFVQNDDPQRLFVWSILSLNFICFILISISYLLIAILSGRSSKSLSSSQNKKQIQKRNNRMNRRIAIIITTDFLCWVPFILICVLHSLEVIDATPWYSLFSMVILPINSVINPLLYDDVVSKTMGKPFRSVSARISNSTLNQKVRGWLNPTTTEEVELGGLGGRVENKEVVCKKPQTQTEL